MARKNHRVKYLIIKIADVLIAMIAIPLGFYVALAYEGGGYTAFWISLGILITLTAIGILIWWWAMEKLGVNK